MRYDAQLHSFFRLHRTLEEGTRHIAIILEVRVGKCGALIARLLRLHLVTRKGERYRDRNPCAKKYTYYISSISSSDNTRRWKDRRPAIYCFSFSISYRDRLSLKNISKSILQGQ